MAERSGFFNALIENGVPDRKYNAKDYSDNLAVVISNGVLRSENDDLKVTASGLILTVNVGRAWINGCWYHNDSPLALTTVVPPGGGSRIDRVVLRFDSTLNARNIKLVYLQGTASSDPQYPVITRTDTVYDLCLADVFVNANASTVSLYDARGNYSVCGWLYSVVGDNSFFTSLDNEFNEWFTVVKNTLASVTLFKKYSYQGTSNGSQQFAFNIPQWDSETCFLEVYVNGLYVNDFTVNNSIITFTRTMAVGDVVVVNCYKSIDGTGINSVMDEVTELQNKVAGMEGVSKFTFNCSGVDDNIALSEIAAVLYGDLSLANVTNDAAETFLNNLGGNTFINSLNNESQITIDVVGKFGAQQSYAGIGQINNRYKWLWLGSSSISERKIIFDFAHCEKITIACGSSYHLIVYGTDLYVKNANIFAYSNGNAHIQMFDGQDNDGIVLVENSRLSVSTGGQALLASYGEFVNCDGVVKSRTNDAYCFYPDSGVLIQVNGGTYCAYNTNHSSSVFAIDSAAGIIATNVNCPIIAVSNFDQEYYIKAYGGKTSLIGIRTTLTRSKNAQCELNEVGIINM